MSVSSFIAQAADVGMELWIGFNDVQYEGTYQWTDESSVSVISEKKYLRETGGGMIRNGRTPS